ncbi:hypothetical protein PENSPDRAFT_658294, partial [Peniophora sp. CONT]
MQGAPRAATWPQRLLLAHPHFYHAQRLLISKDLFGTPVSFSPFRVSAQWRPHVDSDIGHPPPESPDYITDGQTIVDQQMFNRQISPPIDVIPRSRV